MSQSRSLARRTCARLTILLLMVPLGLLGWLWSAGPPSISQARAPVPAQPGKPANLRLAGPRPGQQVAALLAKTVDFGGLDDPKTILVEALDQLAKVHGVTFDVDEAAFRAEKLDDVLKVEIANPNPIPPMKASLGLVLKKILMRVPAKPAAIYLIRRGRIEVTTEAALRVQLGGKDDKGALLPLVHLTAYKLPLDEALASLANQAEMSIALDPRIATKAQTPITMHLINMPLDAALFLLADMADVASVRIDNGFYITSPDRVNQVKTAWRNQRSAPAGSDGHSKKNPGEAGKSATRK